LHTPIWNEPVGLYQIDDKREPFFNTVGQSPLFSITKSAWPTSALSVVPSKEGQKMLRDSDSKMMAPPK